MKWFGVTLGILVFIYTVWVIIAMNRTATVSVNYVDLLNETAASVSEENRAWPYYRKAGIALLDKPMPGSIFYEQEIEEPTWPDQVGWEYYGDWLDQHQETLQTLQTATAKEGFGFILSSGVRDEDKDLWPAEYASQQTEDSLDGFVVSVLLPQLGPMRQMAKLLALDAKDAAYAGDSQRTLEDIQSMLRIGTHVREHPLLINDLVSLAIYNLTFATIGEIVEYEPTLFSSKQFETLEQSLNALEGNFTIRLDGEKYFMLDTLQRIYTDDGEGDGRIIPFEAAKVLGLTDTVALESADRSLVPAIFAPIADLFYASRKEMQDQYTERMGFAETRLGVPLFTLRNQPDVWQSHWPKATSTLDPYFLVDLLMPSLQKAILQGEYTRGKRDATVAILYAVQFHNKTGQWPADLIDAGVVDAWSGKPLLIRYSGDEPLIYSVGFDQEDDGGQFDDSAERWDERSIGDWVIWPTAR